MFEKTKTKKNRVTVFSGERLLYILQGNIPEGNGLRGKQRGQNSQCPKAAVWEEKWKKYGQCSAIGNRPV